MNKRLIGMLLVLSLIVTSSTVFIDDVLAKGQQKQQQRQQTNAITNYKNIEKTNKGLNNYKDKVNQKNKKVKDKKLIDVCVQQLLLPNQYLLIN